MDSLRRSLALLALVAAAVAACGGGRSKEDAEETVREIVRATGERDADKFCDELLTEEFVEKAFGAKGDTGRDACKRQLKALRAQPSRILRVKSVKLKDDRATVTVTLEQLGSRVDQVFNLKDEDGRFRLAASPGS